MQNFQKNLFIWMAIVFVIAMVFSQYGGAGEGKNLAYSEFMDRVAKGEISSAKIDNSIIIGKDSGGNNYSTAISPYMADSASREMASKGAKIEFASTGGMKDFIFSTLLSVVLPVFLFFFLWMFLMKNMQGGGKGGAMGFGKSRARMLTEKHGKVLFSDVAGIDEAKEELKEIVDFLKDPNKFTKLGGKIPKGALLVGPPGTGKTLLARAIAGEAGVPFFTISGSDFVEMFVGVGASRVRDMFEQARKHAPCIVFIDEIDAVGRHRGAGLGGGNDEREQTLNQLLVEMDGFESTQGVILVAATNRPDVLDPALLRPGRFDRQIVVPTPDIKGRTEILNIHLKKVPQAPDIDAKVIARGTPGFSGADLANLVNEAALLAARKDRKVVTMQELEEAKDKVMMGVERKSMVMSDEEKELTAWHEAGHAVVSLHVAASDPIHKATIIPRGRALGMVMRLPERDRLSVTRQKLESDLAVAMGGRVAEELIFGHDKVTSGASSDIKYASSIARNMVTKWGMSDKIGPLFHGEDNEEVFLGYSMGKSKGMSEDTANLIDSEVKLLVDGGYNKAREILTQFRNELELVANSLIEYETLSGDEIRDLVAGKPIRIEPEDNDNAGGTAESSGIPKARKGGLPKSGKPAVAGISGSETI